MKRRPGRNGTFGVGLKEIAPGVSLLLQIFGFVFELGPVSTMLAQ